MTSELRLITLGRAEITRDGARVGQALTAKALALFLYLAVTGEPRPREHLAALFWGDRPEAEAQTNLRQALSKLRAHFPDHLEIEKQSVAFKREAYFLDVQALAQAAQETPADALARLDALLALYPADFLSSLTVKNAPDFEAWVLEARERTRAMASSIYARLVEAALEQGETEAARRALDKVLELDPWNERAHRTKMLLLARRGDKYQALAQYGAVARLVRDEFGIEPAAETIALYEKIRDARRVTAVLPVLTTRLIGRVTERAAIEKLLRQPTTRLVTLLGPGGVGKTRLAVAVAETQANAFLNGVAFVSLQDVATVNEFAFAVGGAVHLAFGRAAEPMTQLAEYLRDQELLVVLDNFEQLVSYAPELARLLHGAPALKLLVTSRVRLALQAEHVYELPGLTDEPAESLFVARARQLRGEFVPDDEAQHAIARIAELVGGLPLALELAAGLVRAASCAQIAAHLEQSLALLESDAPDAPARHRSLRAVFDDSWRALSPTERAVVAQLGVFHGGFTPDAARVVVEASPALLRGLYDKQFLAQVGTRQELHPVLREFALEQLGEGGDAARARHAAYFLGMLADAGTRIVGATEADTVRGLAPELPNLDAAWKWAVEHAAKAQLADASPVLYRFLEASSQFRQAEPLFASAAPLSDVARAYYGGVLYFIGKLDEAEGELVPALAAAETIGDARTQLFCELMIGNVAIDRGAYAKAKVQFRTVLDAARAAKDLPAQVNALNNLGLTAAYQGEFEPARQIFLECLTLATQVGDVRGTAGAWLNLGMIDGNLGAFDAAQEAFERALPLFEQAGDVRGASVCYGNLGEIALHARQLDRAAELYHHALEAYQTLALPERAANMTRNLGTVALERGDLFEAGRLYRHALAEYRRVGVKLGESFALNGLGEVALAQKQPARAAELYRQALRLATEINAQSRACDAVFGLGKVAEAQGDLAAAVERYTLVSKHPAADGGLQAQAPRRLAELQARMEADTFEAAQARGASADLAAELVTAPSSTL